MEELPMRGMEEEEGLKDFNIDQVELGYPVEVPPFIPRISTSMVVHVGRKEEISNVYGQNYEQFND